MSWRKMFSVAAAFNFVIGGLILTSPDLFYATADMRMPTSLLETRLLGWCIVGFGIGYAFIARRPTDNVDLVRMSIIGKVGVFCLVGLHWLAGEATWTLAFLATGDLVWAAAFLAFLACSQAVSPKNLDS
jgi:hypothetical protein